MKRSAAAQWRGNLMHGMGFISTESEGLKNLPYSFLKRFGNEPGTNPEELIAAAHAACFAMAMSAELEKANLRAEAIDVRAEVSLMKDDVGWSIPEITLAVVATVPHGDPWAVEAAAAAAKTNCPVSRLLNARINLRFSLGEHGQAAAAP
jgi:osmotically inducible protein OsmC